jgi:STE24 endopeptidase
MRLSRSTRISGLMAVGRIRALLGGAVVGFVLADVFVLGWPSMVEGLFAGKSWAILIDDVVLMLPAVVMALTVMAFWHRCAARGGSVSLGLGRYLWLRFGVEMGVILVPWLLFVLVTDVTAAFFLGSPHADMAETIVSLLVLLVMVVLSPLLIRVIWHSSPLPDGPLRRRLEALCRRHGFRCRDILVWHTHNHLCNAGVVGPTPLLRYVMLTDSLVRNCTEEEVASVFAHEMGHVHHHHLGFYLLFALGFLCFYVNLVDLLGAAGLVQPLGSNLISFDMTTGQTVVMLAFGAIYWGILFGLISRRMEQQADLYALGAAEEPEAFLNALHTLGRLSGAPRQMSFWRHFGTDRRLDFLHRALDEPSVARTFQVKATAIKMVLVALMVTGVVRVLLVRPELLGL